MELKQLEAFAGVADTKSFSKAAEMLYLTQPTVSAHVAALEKELGVRLFDRTTKSLKLTEAGQRIYPFTMRMLELKNAIEMQAGKDSAATLTIGASTIPATYLLPDILAAFSECEPKVMYKLRQGNSSEIEALVADGSVEIGIIGQEPTTAGIACEYLCPDELVLVTPVNAYYTQLRNEGADFSRLLNEPLILREDGSGTQQFVNKVLEYVSSPEGLNIPVRSNNQESIKRMVTAGAGVSIMSCYAAADLEKQGLAYCYPVEISENRSFYIIYRRDRTLRSKIRELILLAHRMYR